MLYNDTEKKTAEDLVHRMLQRAIAMEGTITGEHGVGLKKREYLREELGEETVDAMRRVSISDLGPMPVLNSISSLNKRTILLDFLTATKLFKSKLAIDHQESAGNVSRFPRSTSSASLRYTSANPFLTNISSFLQGPNIMPRTHLSSCELVS